MAEAYEKSQREREDTAGVPVSGPVAGPTMPPKREIFAPLAPAVEAKWVYLDNGDNQQGPFSLAAMKGWYKAGYLPPNHRVKREGEADFSALHTVLQITTDQKIETVWTAASCSYMNALHR